MRIDIRRRDETAREVDRLRIGWSIDMRRDREEFSVIDEEVLQLGATEDVGVGVEGFHRISASF